jgi:hypothetical protein
MARKGWDQLTPDYKNRLLRKGIDREAHARGESIRAARGHEHTPENPRAYNRQQFRGYAERRDDLTQRLIERKRELFGDRIPDPRHGPRWNSERSERNILEHPPSLKQLQWALEADEEELIDAIREDPEAFAFLGYH